MSPPKSEYMPAFESNYQRHFKRKSGTCCWNGGRYFSFLFTSWFMLHRQISHRKKFTPEQKVSTRQIGFALAWGFRWELSGEQVQCQPSAQVWILLIKDASWFWTSAIPLTHPTQACLMWYKFWKPAVLDGDILLSLAIKSRFGEDFPKLGLLKLKLWFELWIALC